MWDVGGWKLASPLVFGACLVLFSLIPFATLAPRPTTPVSPGFLSNMNILRGAAAVYAGLLFVIGGLCLRSARFRRLHASFFVPIHFTLFFTASFILGVADADAMPAADLFYYEDRLGEDLGALLYLAASGIWLKLSFDEYKRDDGSLMFALWSLFFTVLFFFGFAEEISWGQRIFGYSTPSWMEGIGEQGEFNFHGFLYDFIFFRGVYMAFTLLYGVLLPFLCAIVRPLRPFLNGLGAPVPSPTLGFCMAVAWIVHPFWQDGYANMDEVQELALAVAYFLFAREVFVSRKTGSGRDEALPAGLFSGPVDRQNST
ncbi:MAG: hypothetical protein ACLFOY_02365 [Desulfatibacillaceae bacterium]